MAASSGAARHIPGVARQIAELLLAEVGIDMSRFPTAALGPLGEALPLAIMRVLASATLAALIRVIVGYPALWFRLLTLLSNAKTLT